MPSTYMAIEFPKSRSLQRYQERLEDGFDRVRDGFEENYYVRNIVGGLRLMFQSNMTKGAFFLALAFIFLGIIGPMVAPHHYSEQFFGENGELESYEEPLTENHLLGTTGEGQDVLSRLLYGARPTVMVGVGGGMLIIGIGATIGITAGYLGGRTEGLLMRFTDFVYAIPLIPFAIVILVFVQKGIWTSILVLGLVLWRGNARVLRSQVLQIKERPYIKSAKATGASTSHIVFKHIVPNIASMIVLFFALGIGVSILVHANLAFIGVADPFVPAWGIIVRNAYNSGRMAQAWWWSMPPGFLIALTVLGTFLLGRGYENISNKSGIQGGEQ